jgi:uncharacterized protein
LAGQRSAEPARIVRCPACGGDSVYASSNPFRPFCGERCRMADLGAWASEGYRVGAAPSADDEGSEVDGLSPDAA